MKLNSFIKNIYGRGFLLQVICGMTLSFVTAAAQYAVTQRLGLMIDTARDNPGEILHHFSLMTISVICYLAGHASFTFFSGRRAAAFSCHLQSVVGDKVCSARYQAIEQMETGEFLTIADKDIDGLKNWLMLLWRVGALPVNLLLIPVNMFRFCDWKFALAVLSLIPLNAVISILIARRLPAYYHDEKNAYANVISAFTSTCQFEMMIKSFQLEQTFLQKTKDKLQEHLKKRKRRLAYERFAEVFDRCFGHFSRIFLLLAGACLIYTGDMTMGGLTSIILLAELVGEGLKIIGSIPANLQSAKVSADRMKKLLSMEDEEAGTPQTEERKTENTGIRKNTPVYRVQGLSFSYGKSPILQNLSFQIAEGEKIAIVGPSGGGKTTLFKLLSGLYLPEENQIFFRGKDLTGIPLQILRDNLTVTTQETFLFQTSLKDNVSIAKPDANHQEVMEACRKSRVDALIKSREEGNYRETAATVPSVSNGQMQRINLARAFLKDSEVFLLDEPTSALDRDTADLIWDYLFTGCADKTILVILHDLEKITCFDRILVINQGKIAGSGTHKELLQDCGLYRQLYQNSGERNRFFTEGSVDFNAGV